MSLSATMWTSVSGLLGHGKKMNTIGNNIANISTVGFKGQRMDFADFVYQDTNSLAGATQNGYGVQVGAIMGNFSQGAFETTQEATDLAISGNGFFQVQAVGSDEAYYTRAGNFRFDSEGYLKDPNGFALQGWVIENDGGVQQAVGANALLGATTGSTSPILGSGVPTDIKLDTFTVFPQQTTNMNFSVNLPQEGANNARSTTNPFAALFEVWDGTQPPITENTPAISQSSYAEQTTLQIYDEAGVKHTATVYFDKVDSSSYEGGNSGDAVWEYIVTIDPAEDKRQFVDQTTGELTNVNSTSAGGLLMSGTLTFNSSGALTNQTAYTWGGDLTPEDSPGSYTEYPDPAGGLFPLDVINLDPTDMNNWRPAPISSDGYPLVVANFSGVLDAQTPGTPAGSKYNMEINFGLSASNLAQPWQSQTSLAATSVDPYALNPSYSPIDPLKGPEYIELNGAYDPTASKFSTTRGQYSLDGTAYTITAGNATTIMGAVINQIGPTGESATPGVDPDKVTTDEYAQALKYFGVKSISIESGTLKDALGNTVPTEDITIDLVDGTITGASGTAYALDLGDAEILKSVANLVIDEVSSASISDFTMLVEATPSNANFLAEFTEPAIIESTATTNLGGSFSSTTSQNGYGFGNLTSWTIDSDGVLSGVYSNGVNLPLWQISMYDFNNDQGLRREGNNLFSETKESGSPTQGAAGTAGLGSIASYSLEQSNVDMATEFVYMISTQRGYQANSKSITTTDTMLETVINMKR